MATPTLAISVARESTPIDFDQIARVQPQFTRTVDVVAVIKHETSPVGMAEIFEVHDLQLVSWLSAVDVIDDLVAGTKPNQIDIKFVANRINQADQILVLLLGAVLIALLVNEPGDLGIRPDLVP